MLQHLGNGPRMHQNVWHIKNVQNISSATAATDVCRQRPPVFKAGGRLRGGEGRRREAKFEFLKVSKFQSFKQIESFKVSKFQLLKLWNFETLKLLKLWNFETLKLWNFGTLKLWNFETLKSLKLWKFETLKLWNYEALQFYTLRKTLYFRSVFWVFSYSFVHLE